MIGEIDFQGIKETLDLIEVARQYGVKNDKKGFTLCPFHKENTPSMKIQRDFFYCYGCHVNGDVFDFVGKLYGLGLLDTIKKLNRDYNLGLDEDFSEEVKQQIRDESTLRKADRQYKHEKKNKANKIADKYQAEMRELNKLTGKNERDTKLINARIDVLNDILDEYANNGLDALIYFHSKDRFSGGNYLTEKGIA